MPEGLSERPDFVGAWAGLVRAIVQAHRLDDRAIPTEVRTAVAVLARTVTGMDFGRAMTAEVDAAASGIRARTARAWFDRLGLVGEPMSAGPAVAPRAQPPVLKKTFLTSV